MEFFPPPMVSLWQSGWRISRRCIWGWIIFLNRWKRRTCLPILSDNWGCSWLLKDPGCAGYELGFGWHIGGGRFRKCLSGAELLWNSKPDEGIYQRAVFRINPANQRETEQQEQQYTDWPDSGVYSAALYGEQLIFESACRVISYQCPILKQNIQGNGRNEFYGLSDTDPDRQSKGIACAKHENQRHIQSSRICQCA